jgi:hypothetical protein
MHYRVRGLLDGEAGSSAEGHMAAPEPSKKERQVPTPRGTWQHMGAYPALSLGSKHVRRGTRSIGY